MGLLRTHAGITCRSLTGSATDATRGRDHAIVLTDHRNSSPLNAMKEGRPGGTLSCTSDESPLACASVAEQLGERIVESPLLWVEAKGATSSKVSSARHGHQFTRGQVASHIARAFYIAAASLSFESSGEEERRAALALPSTPNHREFLSRVSGPCKRLGLGVFWVDGPDQVSLDAPWSL
jgi:hypothetical protein